MPELEQTSGAHFAGPLTPTTKWALVAMTPYVFQYYHQRASANDVQPLWDTSSVMELRPLQGMRWNHTHLEVHPNILYLKQEYGVRTPQETLQRFAQVVQWLNQYFEAKRWVEADPHEWGL